MTHSQGGRAQAIAAMGFGTETCPKVDKLFGPGKVRYRGEDGLAKLDAMVSIDMAGPSEVLVIAIRMAAGARRRRSLVPGRTRSG